MNTLNRIMTNTQSRVVFALVFPFWATGVAMSYGVERAALALCDC